MPTQESFISHRALLLKHAWKQTIHSFKEHISAELYAATTSGIAVGAINYFQNIEEVPDYIEAATSGLITFLLVNVAWFVIVFLRKNITASYEVFGSLRWALPREPAFDFFLSWACGTSIDEKYGTCSMETPTANLVFRRQLDQARLKIVAKHRLEVGGPWLDCHTLYKDHEDRTFEENEKFTCHLFTLYQREQKIGTLLYAPPNPNFGGPPSLENLRLSAWPILFEVTVCAKGLDTYRKRFLFERRPDFQSLQNSILLLEDDDFRLQALRTG